MSEHTKGKWRVSSSLLVVDEESRIIANLQPFDVLGLKLPIKQTIANGERICQCVNNFDELLNICKEFVFLEKTNMTKKQVQLRIDRAKDTIANTERKLK